jgi:ketosteroid isomerase-like protein
LAGDSPLELVRASYDAFERGDRDGALAHVDPDIEWHQAQGLPHGGVYRGLAEVRRRVFDPLDRDWWDEFSAVPDELVDAGSTVLVLGRYRGVARGTGRRLDVPFAHVWTFRDGLAIRFRQFLDTAGWNAALDSVHEEGKR